MEVTAMQRLDEKTWAPVGLTSMFDLQRGRESNMAMLEDGDVPLISAKNGSNGLKGFVKTSKRLINGECISLNNDGDGGAGLAYYQPANMALDTHVTALLPKDDMGRDAMLFTSECISGLHGFFGHGLSISNPRAKAISVMLPVTDDGEPDYEYMEQYAAEARKVKLAKYLEYVQKRIDKLGDYVNIPSLDEKEWTKFKAFGDDGLFEIAATSSSIDGIRLKIGKDQSLPYITRTNNGNGVARFVSENNMAFGYDDAGCITVGLDTQTAFYQPHKFVTGQNIQVITGGMFNEYLAQFIIPLMRIQMRAKFNWGGNGATLGRMKTLELMLPVNDSGEPDFEYMEQYSKNMILRKYQQYIAFLDTKK